MSAFYDWGDDPYGGGYHAWGGGYQVPAPWTVAKRMRRPFDDVPVHICGEAYSDQQAWVEGALCTAELMLQEHFGMQCRRAELLVSHHLAGSRSPMSRLVVKDHTVDLPLARFLENSQISRVVIVDTL